jgi:hypothetical protein
MSRLLFVLLGLLAACGDSTELAISERDASESDAAPNLDAGETGGPLVTNAGEPCAKEDDCKGADPTCMTTFVGLPGGGLPGGGLPGGGAGPNVSFPDGYCSADCSDSNQCGAGSECGVAELLKVIGPLLELQGISLPEGVDIPSQCLEICQLSASCRDGYMCQTILDYTGVGAQIPIPLPTKRYCLPAPNTPPLDGGVDAGDDDGGP